MLTAVLAGCGRRSAKARAEAGGDVQDRRWNLQRCRHQPTRGQRPVTRASGTERSDGMTSPGELIVGRARGLPRDGARARARAGTEPHPTRPFDDERSLHARRGRTRAADNAPVSNAMRGNVKINVQSERASSEASSSSLSLYRPSLVRCLFRRLSSSRSPGASLRAGACRASPGSSSHPGGRHQATESAAGEAASERWRLPRDALRAQIP